MIKKLARYVLRDEIRNAKQELFYFEKETSKDRTTILRLKDEINSYKDILKKRERATMVLHYMVTNKWKLKSYNNMYRLRVTVNNQSFQITKPNNKICNLEEAKEQMIDKIYEKISG